MKPLKAITLFYAAMVAVGTVANQCRPAEEGTSHNISCAFNDTAVKLTNQLLWTAVINSTYTKTVATCYFGKCETSPGFKADVKGIHSVLTIDNVSRTDPFNTRINWRCEYSPDVCKPLEVYYRPKEVKCEFLPFNTSSESLPMLCSTDRVFPKASYDVFVSTDKVNFRPIINGGSCNNSQRNETPIYYRADCTMSLPLKHLRTGDNYIKVNITPQVNWGRALAGRESDVYQVTLSVHHHGNMPEVTTSLYLVVALGIGLVIAVCATVFLGVTTFLYKRKCGNLERLRVSQSTKQLSKETPVGYSTMGKPSIDEDSTGELYEDVKPPPRSNARAKPKSLDNIYGNT
ncbi:hypothetical protein BsWGS_12973 [Bradybaena similaris]